MKKPQPLPFNETDVSVIEDIGENCRIVLKDGRDLLIPGNTVGIYEELEKTLRITTHSGRFHPDDIFSYAVIKTLFPRHTLQRSRDQAVIEQSDIVFDVGDQYDPERGRFDHHQKNPPRRSVAAPYSSIGLIWKKWGADFIAAASPIPPALAQEAAQEIDFALIRNIDAFDCGEGRWSEGDAIHQFNATWLEEDNGDARFAQAAGIIQTWLTNLAQTVTRSLKAGIPPAFGPQFARLRDLPEIRERARANAKSRSLAEDVLRECAAKAKKSKSPHLLELPHYALPWPQIINTLPECNPAEHVIFRIPSGNWMLQCVPSPEDPFQPKKPLPQAWAGKRNEELDETTGVPGGVFCHNARFICGHKTKEGALALYQKTRQKKPQEITLEP